MKKRLGLIQLALIVCCLNTNAQSVAINNNGTNPDNSAMLDISSTNKGLLMPRMTMAQRDSIINPATGLIIFQVDNIPGFYFNAGTGALPGWTRVETVGAGNDKWASNDSSIYNTNTGNVGIGTNVPMTKFDVNGKIKANALMLNSVGAPHDFLVKSNVNGDVGFKKAMGGVGINYIICLSGSWPYNTPTGSPFLGEIKAFAGSNPPIGWAICNGQVMSIAQHTALYAILGLAYGGNGQTTFALPDLRGAMPVGLGVAQGGYEWDWGEKRN